MKKIKILGAGVSGLTAAINLSLAGFAVDVFEKNKDCGMRFHGDMQGLENWSDKEDVLDALTGMHIDINFEATPFRKVLVTNSQEEKEFAFDKPLFYLITRGSMDGSLDQGLKNQALEKGVKIHFEKTIDESEADIIATGPNPNKSLTIIDKGIVFKTDLPNIAVSVVNDQAAYQGYSYLLVANGMACLCTCLTHGKEHLNDCFEFTKKYFTEKYKLKIENPQIVGGIFNFNVNHSYKKDKSRLVGEAAGLQDFLFGFGMRTAFNSGYLAAKSIIERIDYKKLAEEKFSDYLKAGIVNRYGWEHADTDNYTRLLEKMDRDVNGTNFERSIYNFNLFQHIEYPIALKYIADQYPDAV